jgi:sulfide:quinone oxidoreductase
VPDVARRRGREARRTVSISLIEANRRRRVRVLIAGGGVAALEAVLALRALAPDLLEIELMAPVSEFHARPLAVGEPFGLVQPRRLALAAFAAENGARFRRAALAEVDVCARVVITEGGERVGYDALLVATGAEQRPLLSGALTFRGRPDVRAFRELLRGVDEGSVRSVVFALPSRTRWSLPLYELALMTAAHAAAHGVTLRVEVVTHEREPLALFGPRVARRLRSLLRGAGIRLRTSATPLVAQPGRLFLASGTAIAADRVVALAKLVVPRIPGLPQGPGGFIPTDGYGRVDGAAHVYAAGDVTWFPVKQGGIAAEQADAAASALAADAGADVTPEPFSPVLRGILLTGEEPHYVRAEPSTGGRGEVDVRPLWLPLAKVAGRRLGPYLTGGDGTTAPETLVDLHPNGEPDEHAAALELALEAADAAAGWDDPADALRWLGVAEALNVALPMGYADKRRDWSEALAARSG